MAQAERQQAVQSILQNLRDLDGLKKLFWEELNYERKNQPLSPRQWPDNAKNALAEDPVLFASGGVDDAFHIPEKVFRGSLTGAVKRELTQLSRNSVTGENLLKSLIKIYDQHNLKDASARRNLEMEDRPIPRIVCSEAFV